MGTIIINIIILVGIAFVMLLVTRSVEKSTFTILNRSWSVAGSTTVTLDDLRQHILQPHTLIGYTSYLNPDSKQPNTPVGICSSLVSLDPDASDRRVLADILSAYI